MLFHLGLFTLKYIDMIGCKGNPSWWNNIPKEYKIQRCYHTTWQSHSGFRFILLEVKDDKGLLRTKSSPKTYWSKLSELRDTNTHSVRFE